MSIIFISISCGLRLTCFYTSVKCGSVALFSKELRHIPLEIGFFIWYIEYMILINSDMLLIQDKISIFAKCSLHEMSASRVLPKINIAKVNTSHWVCLRTSKTLIHLWIQRKLTKRRVLGPKLAATSLVQRLLQFLSTRDFWVMVHSLRRDTLRVTWLMW